MESVRKLESLVASWYKNMPHLPAVGQKWLAENAWWLVLVWVILTAMGIASMIFAALLAGGILTLFGPVGATIGAVTFFVVAVSMVFSIAVVVLGAMAITPLKMQQRKGWTLLFMVTLVNVAASVLTFIFNFNLIALIWNLLFVAIGAYFLFEIRDLFGSATGRKKVTAQKKKTEKTSDES